MGRLKANYNSSKNNKISIKKQNLGGGKLLLYKAFAPNDLQNLSLWLKADTGVDVSSTLYITQVIITGFTGIYSGANGTYNGNSEDQYFQHTSGLFYIEGNTLYDSSNDIAFATNSNNYQGAWTPLQYFSTITLSNAGTTYANGVYTRTDSAIDMTTETFYSGGKVIVWDNNDSFWFMDYDYYRNYTFAFDEDWSIENGAGPQPDATYSNSSRNVGSPTSTITGVYPIISWADQSGNSRNATVNNGIPLPVTIDGKSFVSLPAYVNLVCPQIWLDIQFVGTIFCVARFTENGPNQFLLNHENNFIFFRDTSNSFSLTLDDSTVLTSNNQLAINTNYILEAKFNASAASISYNGTLAGSENLGSVIGGYNLFIGGGGGPSYIAEMIVYDRVLTDAERLQVGTYLKEKYAITYAISCGYQNTNKLVETSGNNAPIGLTFNHIALDYASFAGNCLALGLDPATILNDLGGVDFSSNYVVIRAKTSSSINSDSISDLGGGIINITNVGPQQNVPSNYYRFFVMCKEGWTTVRFYGLDYTI